MFRFLVKNNITFSTHVQFFHYLPNSQLAIFEETLSFGSVLEDAMQSYLLSPAMSSLLS